MTRPEPKIYAASVLRTLERVLATAATPPHRQKMLDSWPPLQVTSGASHLGLGGGLEQQVGTWRLRERCPPAAPLTRQAQAALRLCRRSSLGTACVIVCLLVRKAGAQRPDVWRQAHTQAGVARLVLDTPISNVSHHAVESSHTNVPGWRAAPLMWG